MIRALNESAGRLFRAATQHRQTTLIIKVTKGAKIRKSVNQRIREGLITYCVCDFFFHDDRIHDVKVPENIEFDLLTSDSLI